MHTATMMDYIDSQPERFLRGGECATTVPTIQVVVPGHYAWALPVAAGIATNRAGVPWGFLNSVNDVTKWNGADKDQTLVLAHPNVLFSGTFTYTTIHEASHYLGLAHPHDTVGAVRGEDGEPVYYDGFAWTFNTTAAPTTYSHVETVYSILDQESIARGHMTYYLSWTGEALEEAGAAFASDGVETIDELSEEAYNLRRIATWKRVEAQERYADFEFVAATFSAQDAWRAAAALRDIALDLEPGTSQVEKGTQHGTDAELDAAGCPEPSAAPSPSYDPGPAARAGQVGAGAIGGVVSDDEGHDHGSHEHGTVDAAGGDQVAVAARPAASSRDGAGAPPLAAAVVAAVMIVAVLRLLARRLWAP